MRRATRIGLVGLWAATAALSLGRVAAAQAPPSEPAGQEDAVGYDEPKLERRRPKLSLAIAPGRDITLEADLSDAAWRLVDGAVLGILGGLVLLLLGRFGAGGTPDTL